MVLEDETMLYELLQDLLKYEGYEVIKPSEPDQALKEMHTLRPHAVLIDVHLKDMNGLDLLDRIRQDEELRDTFVVMSSGIDYQRESVQRGADGFIMKPYMPEELLRLLNKKIKQ
jgi:DNA-binding response OmpR family regulator